MRTIRRVLYYTHNSVGVGHIFRARAIITAMRRWRMDMDFLVLSGTSVPHILLREGIEVIKLPGVEQLMIDAASPVDEPPRRPSDSGDSRLYEPRHIRSLPLTGLMKLRRKIIAEAFTWFDPDVVMVEHYLGGLLDEMMPVLRYTRPRQGSGRAVRVALSRGLIGRHHEIFTTCGRNRAENILKYYDLFYCFDDEEAMRRDGRPESLSLDHRSGVACLGRITDKCREELPERRLICERFSLTKKPIILLSLSRHGDIVGLCTCLLESFQRIGLHEDYQVIFVIDPYLKQGVVEKIRRNPLAAEVRFLPFFYPLVDIMHASDLVICRAGYNTVNELLLTGVKAIVIPEHHPSGEQERRAASIPPDNITVMREDAVLEAPLDAVVKDIIARPAVPLSYDFNKYAIGRRIITDLEACLASPRDSS